MDDEDWIVVGEGVRGEWLSSPETLAAVHPPVLFVRDPLTDPADARALAMALARLGERILWVDTESMSPPHSPSGPTADGADALWEREEGYPDRQAVRELDLLAGAMGPERPAVVGVGMGATWADYDQDGLLDLYTSNMYSRAGRRITGAIADIDPRLRRAARGNTLFHNGGAAFTRASSLEPST